MGLKVRVVEMSGSEEQRRLKAIGQADRWMKRAVAAESALAEIQRWVDDPHRGTPLEQLAGIQAILAARHDKEKK